MYELAMVIGVDAAKAAIEAFAGRRCLFSKMAGVLDFPTQEAKTARFKELYYGGATYEEIAAQFGLTANHIRNTINKTKN
jgi:DNA invertase Pin-like site-specific DNA recombinase